MDEMLSIAAVGRSLGKSPRAVAREILRGKLVAYRIGRTYRVAPADLADYLERMRVRPPGVVPSPQLQAAIAAQRHVAAERMLDAIGI